MEFEANMEEDLGDIRWGDGIFKRSKYIEHWCIGMWEKAFLTFIKNDIRDCTLMLEGLKESRRLSAQRVETMQRRRNVAFDK